MEILKEVTLLISDGVESFAALVVGLASLQAIISAIPVFLSGKETKETSIAKETIRLTLGRWLALALELELGADILRTTVAPTWNEIGQLGAIIVLRTALNFFLQLEIEKAGKRK